MTGLTANYGVASGARASTALWSREPMMFLHQRRNYRRFKILTVTCLLVVRSSDISLDTEASSMQRT